MARLPVTLLLACVFGGTLLSMASSAKAENASGILYWTEILPSGKSRVRFEIFVPQEVTKPINFEKKKPNQYTPLGVREKGVVTYEGERLKGDNGFSIMHPVPDHTGVRMYFSSGVPITFKQKSEDSSPDSIEASPPETKISQYVPGKVFAEASEEWKSCCFAAPTKGGDAVYYTRFGLEYFDLIRQSLQGEDDQEIAIEGLWPSVSEDNQYLLYARRMTRADNSEATPLAVGVYIADISDKERPPEGDTAVTPGNDAEDRSFPFASPEGESAFFSGPIRCGKPTWGKGGEIIFPVQDYRTGSQDTTWNIFRALPDGGRYSYECLFADTSANLMWPSASIDGKWVAYCRHSIEDDTYSVCVHEIGAKDPIVVSKSETIALWPHFDSDCDPPNLEIQLQHGNSKKPTTIRLIDVEPETSLEKDSFELYCAGQNFSDKLSTMFSPSTTMVLSWQRNPQDTSHKLRFTLTTKKEWVYDDKHPPYVSFEGEIPSEYAEHPIDALYLVENVRLKVGTLARDNRYLRQESGDMNPKVFDRASIATNYDDGSWEAEHGSSGRNADPPYFPRLKKSSADENYPGLCWWIEDEDRQLISGTDGAFHPIIRQPNYPPTLHPNGRPLWFRVLAQDLWGNEVDIAIPVWVWDRKFSADILGYESKKQR